MIKVKGGTRPDGPSICSGCRRSVTMLGAADSDEKVYCHEIGEFLKTRVVQCSSFEDKSKPTLYDMRDAALILVMKKNREIGFIRSAEFRKEYKEDILPDSVMYDKDPTV